MNPDTTAFLVMLWAAFAITAWCVAKWAGWLR